MKIMQETYIIQYVIKNSHEKSFLKIVCFAFKVKLF